MKGTAFSSSEFHSIKLFALNANSQFLLDGVVAAGTTIIIAHPGSGTKVEDTVNGQWGVTRIAMGIVTTGIIT